jgi:hypothetical protein
MSKPVKPRVSIKKRQRIDYFTAKLLLHDVFPSINRNYSNGKDNTLRKPEAVK